MTWPWQRRRQAAGQMERADSGGSVASTSASTGAAETGDSKAARQSSLQGPAQQLVAVLVMQPDDKAMVGVTHVPAPPGEP